MKHKTKDDISPIVAVKAKVAACRHEIHVINNYFESSHSVSRTEGYNYKKYFVDFELEEGGGRKSFCVKHKTFNQLTSGQIGILTYKDDKLISFVTNSECIDNQ
jgi:hypothetical protein